MDILEAREVQLREQLFGARTADSSSNLTDTISVLNARVDHLYGAVAGFSKLTEMCSYPSCCWTRTPTVSANLHNPCGDTRFDDVDNSAQRELEMQPSSTLGSSAPKAGEEIKRAVILSSDDRIDQVATEFRKLKEMQSVLAQLEQLRSRSPVDSQQLSSLENQTELQTQRALALHARVERVLAIYQEMISFSFLFLLPPIERNRECLSRVRIRVGIAVSLTLPVVAVVHIQILSEKCVEYSVLLDEVTESGSA